MAEGDALSIAGDFVALRVADSGAAMPAEIISPVFEPFFTTKDEGHWPRPVAGLRLRQHDALTAALGGAVRPQVA